jgi:hypothetical protein
MKTDENLEPKLSDYASYVMPRAIAGTSTAIKYRLIAKLVMIIGTSLALAFVILLSFIILGKKPIDNHLVGFGLVFLLIICSAPVLILSNKFARLARSHEKDDEQEIIKDTRPPILYLRSFPDEEGSFMIERSFEENLVSVLNDFGPVVAVGNPKDTLPLPGAIRLYFHDDWQEKVSALMDISRLVVFNVGLTPGFLWELRTALDKFKEQRDKILLSFMSVGTPKRIEEFNQAIVDYPEFEPIRPIRRKAFFIYFDDDKRPHVIYAEPRTKKDLSALLSEDLSEPYNPLYIAAYLQPVLQRLSGSDEPVRPPNTRRIILVILLYVIAAALLLMKCSGIICNKEESEWVGIGSVLSSVETQPIIQEYESKGWTYKGTGGTPDNRYLIFTRCKE